MREIIDKIDYNFKSKFYYNYDTSKNVWFRTGGKAKVFCIVDNEKELSIILQNLKDIPYEVIGAGSNILIRDSGYEGFLIKLAMIRIIPVDTSDIATKLARNGDKSKYSIRPSGGKGNFPKP